MSEDQLEDLGNVAVNIATLGLAGLDEDGKVTKGLGLRAVDEGIGEVTGRNAARKQMMETKDQIREEKEAKVQEFKDEQIRNQRNDIAASNAAGAAQKASKQQNESYLGNDPSQDFLGL